MSRIGRCGLATLFVALVLVLVGPGYVKPAGAVDNCGKVVPMDALTGGTVASLATGALVSATVVEGAAVAGATVASGGATVAAGATVGGVAGNAVFGAAAFLGAFYGTCRALDWITGDAALYNATPFYSSSSVTVGPQVIGCAGYPSNMTAPAANDVCRSFTMAGALSNTSRIWNNFSGIAAYAGVSIPAAENPTGFSAAYPGAYSQLQNMSVSAKTAQAGPVAWCTPNGSTGAGCRDANGYGGQTVVWIKNRCDPGFDLGGVCSAHPAGAIYGVPDNTSMAFSFVRNANPEVQAKGWQRTLKTDVYCHGGSAGWVTLSSGTFWDGEVTTRTPVPSCANGQIPTVIRTFKIPLGVTCSLGAATCSSALKINEWLAPSSWTGGSPPAWLTPCLGEANNCGAPTVVNGTCVWGGANVPYSYCDPGRQAGTSTRPATQPKPELVVSPVATATGQPISTVQPVQDPSPTTTTATTSPPGSATVVPIDADGETSARPRTGAESAACWPGGWGWFNPLQWVLRPIKCALEWGFVPPAGVLDTKLAAFDALRTQPPIQWVDEGVDWVAGSIVIFAAWSTAGPDCTDVLGVNVCPRTWDTTAVPAWVGNALLVGLWFVVVVGVWRFF